MAKKNNKKCIVCGKIYSYCNSCAEHRFKPLWMNIYHDENCRSIFNIAADYHAGKINKEKAKELFNECDLSNLLNFKESIYKLINELCFTEEIVKEQDNQEIVIETTREVESVEKIVENTVEEVKPKLKRTRKKNLELVE